MGWDVNNGRIAETKKRGTAAIYRLPSGAADKEYYVIICVGVGWLS